MRKRRISEHGTAATPVFAVLASKHQAENRFYLPRLDQHTGRYLLRAIS